jgi:hypothetical protein
MDKVQILQAYRDKCYINNILCQKSSEFFDYIRTFISIPLILSSGVLTILNSSSLPSTDMKTANIIINGTTTLILGLVNNLKLPEKVASFRSIGIKFNKLCHHIEDRLNNSIDAVDADNMRDIIKQYDDLNELLEFHFPHHIKEKIKNNYKTSRVLPNVLNCEVDFVHSHSKPNEIITDRLHSQIVNANVPAKTPRVLEVKIDPLNGLQETNGDSG